MFQWCDEVGKIQSQRVNSPVKPINQYGAAASQNPICTCTAGPCRIETKQHGEWKGRKYFACHLKSVMVHYWKLFNKKLIRWLVTITNFDLNLRVAEKTTADYMFSHNLCGFQIIGLFKSSRHYFTLVLQIR